MGVGRISPAFEDDTQLHKTGCKPAWCESGSSEFVASTGSDMLPLWRKIRHTHRISRRAWRKRSRNMSEAAARITSQPPPSSRTALCWLNTFSMTVNSAFLFVIWRITKVSKPTLSNSFLASATWFSTLKRLKGHKCSIMPHKHLPQSKIWFFSLSLPMLSVQRRQRHRSAELYHISP